MTTALDSLREVATTNASAIQAAASLLHPVIASGGIIHAFGTGHSQAAAMEFAGRAGGLIPTNRISLSDIVLRGQAAPSALSDPLLERRPDVVGELLELADVRPGDGFVIISNSGTNASIVEMARLVVERGVPLIAVTSTRHSNAVPTIHASGQRLLDVADVVLDNGAPLGDAMLDYGGGKLACGISSMTSAMLMQMLTAEIIARMVADGTEPPVYVSANMPDGHEHNLEIEIRYGGRLHRIAG